MFVRSYDELDEWCEAAAHTIRDPDATEAEKRGAKTVLTRFGERTLRAGLAPRSMEEICIEAAESGKAAFRCHNAYHC